MAIAAVQEIRWEGSRLPDQVLKCGCGTPIFEIVRGRIKTLDKHHGQWHPNEVQLVPLDNSGKV